MFNIWRAPSPAGRVLAAAVVLATCTPSNLWAAIYSEVNSPASVNWNTAPWASGEPTGANQLVGLLHGGGVMEINTVESAGGLLVGWLGGYTVNMTGGSLTLGTADNDRGLFLSENGSGQGTFNHSAGTVDTPFVNFNRGGSADFGAYHLSGTANLSTAVITRSKGTATFSFDGGTLTATASGANWFGAGITAPVLAGGATIDSQGFDVTLQSALVDGGGGGGLTKVGAHVLRLAAANSYTGDTHFNNGFLVTNVNAALPSSTLLHFGAAGALAKIDLQGTQQTVRGLVSAAAPGNDLDIYSVSNTGVLTIDTPLGETHLYGGKIGVGFSAANRDFSVVKEGAGTQILAGSSFAYTGATSINGGTLQIGDNNASANLGTGGAYVIAADAQLVFSRNIDNVRFTTHSISGDGDLVFRGQQNGYFSFHNDPPQFTGTLSYTGRTIVNLDDNPGNAWYQGVLWLETPNVTPAASVVELQTGKIYLREAQAFAGLTGNAGTFVTTDQAETLTLNVATGQTYDYAGAIGADGTGVGNNNLSLTKLGLGTQILSGANTYTNGTTISAGSLQVGNGGASGALGSGTVTNNAALVFDRSDSHTVNNFITGFGTVTQQGVGTTILNAANNYTGQTFVNAGTLQIGDNNASTYLGASNFNIAAGAQLAFSRNINDTKFTNQSISGAGDVLFRGQQGGYFTFRNDYLATLSHTGRTIVDLDDNPGNTWYQGALWLEKDNVLPHATVVQLESGKIYTRAQTGAGLTIAGLTGNAGTFITTDQNAANLQKWTIDTPWNQTYDYAGVIGADGTGVGNNHLSLTKQGLGTQILSGANTYLGTTTINAGTLLINGAHTGGGLYTINSGATLGGTGTITPFGSAGINVSGSVAPGASLGTLAFDLGSTTGGVTMQPGAIFQYELGAPGTSDLIQVFNFTPGDLVLNNNSIFFSDAGGFSPGLYTLFEFFSDNGTTPVNHNLVSGLEIGGLAGGYLIYNGNQIQVQLQTLHVPEPTSLALLTFGAIGLTLTAVRRNRRR